MLTYWKSITKHLQTREWTLYSYAPTMTHVPLPLGTDAEPILFLYLPPHEIVRSLGTVFNAHFISISGVSPPTQSRHKSATRASER